LIDYWQQRYQRTPAARAVRRLDFTEEQNASIRSAAQRQLATLLAEDFEDPRSATALDLGCGTGDYLQSVLAAGFSHYLGVDFAAPLPASNAQCAFRRADIAGTGLCLGRQFELVLLIDVAFHVVDDEAFDFLMDNVRRHATGMVYVTGLFRDDRLAPHVLHRRIERFSQCRTPISIHPWRDTLLVRFRAGSPATP
jgi:SAM-dependent methyltransferase